MGQIAEMVLDAKGAKIRQSPVNTNRASVIGHECLRYLVYERIKWQEKTLHNARLQSIFDLGTVFEDSVLKDLKEAGITVIEQQRAFEWKEYLLTGHTDGKILWNGGAYPLEIKSSSPYAFDSINSIEDIKNHKYPYMRRYMAQITVYLLLSNIERGLLLFKNKVTGAIKDIWVDLDYSMGESLLKKAESINNHVISGTIPDPIEYNESICGDCGYQHICLPDHTGAEVEIDTGELATMLDRLEELKPAKKEYDDLDEQVKKSVEGREKILAGDWLITGKWQERKEMLMKATRFWRRTVRRAA